MRSSGMIRGIMARNDDNDKFIRHIINTLSREFDLEYDIEILAGEYIVRFGEYDFKISKSKTKELQTDRSPYKIDKYILNKLENKGMSFSRKRSPYICNVFGTFELDENNRQIFPEF